MELVARNPCSGFPDNETTDRDRHLFPHEIKAFWPLLSAVLKVVLLTGQRPGEVAHMRWEHIVDDWWCLPGFPQPDKKWPGTKNKRNHRVYLSAAVRQLIGSGSSGFVFPRRHDLDEVMRDICEMLAVAEKVTPRDLRRTFGTMVTRLKFGREAMDRILNHKKKTTTDVYDRYGYLEEDERIMEAVAAKILELAG